MCIDPRIDGPMKPTAADARRMRGAGADAILLGEALMGRVRPGRELSVTVPHHDF
jgi:indole-3-glycerol phosphate synthase